MERTAAHQGAGPFTVTQAPGDEAEEGDDDGDLDEDDEAVEVRHQLDTAQVQEGHHGHQTEDEDPGLHGGEHGGQVDLGQQDVVHRHEHVVQQGRPAHHEAHIGVKHLLGIGVGGACGREAAHQVAVAERGQQDAAERQQVGGGHATIRDVTDDGEGIEYRHGREVSQTHHHDLEQGEGLEQLGTGHHAFSSAQAPWARWDGIRDAGTRRWTQGAPICGTDAWRTPAGTGRKAVKCPMFFLTTSGDCLAIWVSIPAHGRPLGEWWCAPEKQRTDVVETSALKGRRIVPSGGGGDKRKRPPAGQCCSLKRI